MSKTNKEPCCHIAHGNIHSSQYLTYKRATIKIVTNTQFILTEERIVWSWTMNRKIYTSIIVEIHSVTHEHMFIEISFDFRVFALHEHNSLGSTNVSSIVEL